MGAFVADAAVKEMILAGLAPKNAKVIILGVTFKENCPDIRNSKVIDIVKRLREYGISPLVSDPMADAAEVFEEYGIEMIDFQDVREADCIILAVAHTAFRTLSAAELDFMFQAAGNKVLVDVKGIVDKKEAEQFGWLYWRL